MKAIRIHEPGGPEAMRLDEIEVPKPASGQILVKQEVAGVNFIDVYHRTGLYKLPLPAILGMEAGGTVESVGEGVTEFQPGDRVAYTSVQNSYAGYNAIPTKFAAKVPEGVDLKTATAAMLQGMTAHYLTHSTFPLQPGQTALLHAAAGGTGSIIVQLAKMRGARVIGTVGTEEKAEIAKGLGVDHVINYSTQDFEAEVKRITEGKGVDVVYDSVGKSTWEKSLNSLRPRGMMVSFGNASGPVGEIAPLILSQKGSLFLTRPTLAHYIAERSEFEWRARDLFGAITAGKLKINVDRTYPLAEAAQAHRDLEARQSRGKLLLVI
jgi:NADPH:quinone reductase